MSAIQYLSVLALQQVLGERGETVLRFLGEHFSDHGHRLEDALRQSADRAWRTLEVALAAPKRVERLVLISATAGIEDEQERARRRAADERLAAELERMGVRMVIYANHGMRAAIRAMEQSFAAILRDGSTRAVEDAIASVQDVFDLQAADRRDSLVVDRCA